MQRKGKPSNVRDRRTVRSSHVTNAAKRTIGALAFVWLSGCYSDPEPVFDNLRVYSSPYQEVDWINDVVLMTQHHDHSGTNPAAIRAYDQAGYDAVSLMDYSGSFRLSTAWKQRRWPPEQWLSAGLRAGLTKIQFFIPNAEEVGDPKVHMTSPFLERYIEYWNPDGAAPQHPWQYGSGQELVDLTRQMGGSPCVAHLWAEDASYADYAGIACVEIYSAFAEARRAAGVQDFTSIDRNQVLLDRWDAALRTDQTIVGIAVNDHFGPYLAPGAVPAEVIDSGKILVIAKAASLPSYREAFDSGRIFAVKEMTSEKGLLPRIGGVVVNAEFVEIDTDGEVRWISNGLVIHRGSRLSYEQLPINTTYVRVEIAGIPGVTLYSQAFSVRPVGDTDGNYTVDRADDDICGAVESGIVDDRDQVAACMDRKP